MTVERGIEFGAQRYTYARVPVRPASDPERGAANRAAIATMDDAQRLTGLTASQLDDNQARLRREREQRIAARPCQCGDDVANVGCTNCRRCGGVVIHTPFLREVADDRFGAEGEAA